MFEFRENVDERKIEQDVPWFERLELTEEEKNVLEEIHVEDIEVEKGSSGTAKVEGDCVSTTCTYTETFYYCASTGD